MTARPSSAGAGRPGPAPTLTAAEVARRVGGTLRGDGAVAVRAVAPLGRAGAEEISFLSSAAYLADFRTTRAGVVLVAPEFADSEGPACRVIVERPPEAMLKVLPALYVSAPRIAGVHETAFIGRGVQMGADVAIGPFAVIGGGAVLGDRVMVGPHCSVGHGVRIGDESELVSHVTLYAGTILGKRVRLHAGVRAGSDGFGYVYADGAHQKIPHVGRCIIEDDVEIGANSAIDRGSIDDTVIGAGSKLDNLVHIAHNVVVGRNCIIMGQVGFAGSTHLGDYCVVASQSGIAGHLKLGNQATVGAKSGVMRDVPDRGTVLGIPAAPDKQAKRQMIAVQHLPEIIRRMRELEKQVEQLRAKSA